MHNAASDEFFLNLHENVTGDNGFMAVFHIVLRHDAIVLDPLLREKVNCVGFLQQSVADIFLIS